MSVNEGNYTQSSISLLEKLGWGVIGILVCDIVYVLILMLYELPKSSFKGEAVVGFATMAILYIPLASAIFIFILLLYPWKSRIRFRICLVCYAVLIGFIFYLFPQVITFIYKGL